MSMYEAQAYEGEYQHGYSGEFGELQEAELAAEILEIASEQELEEFLDGLVKAAGSFLSGSVGKALGGVLKNVAKTALPVVGGALGSFVAPGIGTAIGSKLGSMAGGLFEAEGYETGYETSYEQEQFETARKLVQLATTAAQAAQAAPPHVPAEVVAEQAVREAARRLGISTAPQHEAPWGQEAEWGQEAQWGQEAEWAPQNPYAHEAQWGQEAEAEGEYGFRGRGWRDSRRRYGGPSGAYGSSYSSPAMYGDPYGGGGDENDQSQPSATGRWIRRGNRIIVFGA